MMSATTSPAVQREVMTARYRPSVGFLVASIVFLFWLVSAIAGPWFVPHDPFVVAPQLMLEPPGAEYFFGTDELGRDVFSRVIVGSRDILTVSFFAALLGTALGTLLGLCMGYVRGVVDEVLSRIGETVISLPGVIMALLLIAALGRSNTALIGVIAFEFLWVVARTVRGAVLEESGQDYVLAARARGDGALFVMLRELFPNVFPIVIVEFTVRMTFAVFAVANLSFLGFGVQPPAPDWGLQVAESYGLLISGEWWVALFPTLAIASLVISIYVIANEANRWLSGASLSS
ncbi:MAG: binding-protein-dependent transport system inner rane component [Microvirga sp.]|jgi:peptide/nickel transport system permease protein|nr:binding-protein-dependent transport system inner rane component [Microvirga sp.]